MHVKTDQSGAKDFGFCDTMADFCLVFPDEDWRKLYLSIIGESFVEYFDSLED